MVNARDRLTKKSRYIPKRLLFFGGKVGSGESAREEDLRGVGGEGVSVAVYQLSLITVY